MSSQPLRLLMGGTFDPVHIGHLRIALELSELFQNACVNLMPCYLPVHRNEPGRSAAHRLNMLKLATDECPGIDVDDREIRRGGPSYTVDTLREVRQTLGASWPLAIVIGQDTFNQFSTWKDWQEIPALAHVVVVTRPGYAETPVLDALTDYRLFAQSQEGGLSQEIVEYLTTHSAGSIAFLSLSMLTVASTDIRERLVAGKSVKYLLPDTVIDYIEKHQLYRR